MRVSRSISITLILVALISSALGQRGRVQPTGDERGGMLLNVVAARADKSGALITAKDVSLFDNGIEQSIKSLTPDPSPAKIVLLVDNSQTLRVDVEKMSDAVREFAYEIYEGDKLMVVGYDEQPEIVLPWDDNAKKVEASLGLLRKKGEPHLFDALHAVLEEALRPLQGTTQKRVIIIISDGLDRGSITKFDEILAALQKQDITVYALQIPDRTGGALRRDSPKPEQVVQKLVEGTGGRVFSIKEPREAAQSICDELRKNRYVLAYTPTDVMYTDARRLLIVGNEGINIRAKTLQPPH